MILLAFLCGLELIGTIVLVKLMLDGRERAEAAWAAERAALVQRIQAPQAATSQYHHGVEVFAPPAVDVTDEGDDDYWEAKEELADRLAQAEVTGG